MKELINEQNGLLVGASALFTYFQVPVGFIALLSAVMFVDFLTGISKEIILRRDLSIQVFWVGLLKKNNAHRYFNGIWVNRIGC